MTIYMNNLLFNYYENKYVKDHFHYVNSKYTLPNHKALSNHILNNYYNTIYKKIDRELQSSRWLNLYINESNNIKRQRVINFLTYAFLECDSEGECFYIKSEINNFKTMNTKTQLEFVLRQTLNVINEQL